jgi:TetR/AcrR family transcriptional regulator
MAIADRRKREREQRRNGIIDAAEKLFFARGYDNVTMDEIANEAEVNKALLYYYFKNKEALFFSVYLRVVQMLYEIHLKSSKLNIDGLGKLQAMGRGTFEFSKEYPDHFRLYSYAGTERFHNTDNEDARKSTEIGIKMWRLLVEAFMQGMEEGVIRNDMDPVEMAVYLNLISMSTLNINPVFKMILKDREINQDDIWNDLGRFIRPALTNRPYSDLESDEDNSSNRK